jgi:spore germination protein PF
MPSIVGAFKVVSNSGTLNNGDSFIIAPTSSTKSYTGSGSGVTGDFSATFTMFSAVLVNDPDIVDDSANKVATGA